MTRQQLNLKGETRTKRLGDEAIVKWLSSILATEQELELRY